MRRVMTLVLIVALGMFIFCGTATAHTYIPTDHGKVKESYFGLTGSYFSGAIGESDFAFDNSSAPDVGFIELGGFQMFSGVHPGTNHNSLKNAFWKDSSIKHMNKWYDGDYVGWSFWSVTFFSTPPTDDQLSTLFEQRLELVLNALNEYFDGREGENPDPPAVPVPAPILLLASGLVGFVGLRRMSRN